MLLLLLLVVVVVVIVVWMTTGTAVGAIVCRVINNTSAVC